MEHGHGSELQRCELDLALSEVEGCDLSRMLVAPLRALFVPNSNLNLGCILAHVNRVWQNEFDLDSDVSCDMSRWVRVRDVTQTLFHGKDWSHGPLCCLFTLLWVLVHLKVDNSSNDEVILNLVRGQVIVARPESPYNDLTTSLLLRQLCDMIVEDDIMTVLVLACNVCPDSKQNITLTSANMENVLARLISL